MWDLVGVVGVMLVAWKVGRSWEKWEAVWRMAGSRKV